MDKSHHEPMETATGGHAVEFIPSFANLHSELPTQAGIEKKTMRVIPPLTSIESTGPIQFVVTSGSEEQIYPMGMRVYCEFQIRDERHAVIPWHQRRVDADPAHGILAVAEGVTPMSQVFPVNGISTAMFSDIEVRLNDTKVESNDGMYAYKADIQKRLFTTSENKRYSMRLGGYHSEALPFDKFNADLATLAAEMGINEHGDEADVRRVKGQDKVGTVWNERWLQSRNSATMRVIDKIYSELFNQPRLLPPGAKLTITFGRSKPEFCLLSPHENHKYSIHMIACRLMVPIVACEEKLVRQIEYKCYEGSDMKYPIRRVELHTYAKSRNITDLSIDNVLLGDVTPRRIFVMMVASEAIHGNLKNDPFNYQNFKVEEIACRLGGQEGAVPVIKVKYDEGSNGDIMAVNSLLSTLGSENSMEEIGIELANFRKRSNIYAFDINGCAGVEFDGAYTREQKIPTGLSIKLKEAYNGGITVLVYKEYDAEITCDKNNKVTFHPYA